MRQWPSSLPDYAWPESFGSPGMVIARLVMACVFHVAYILGLMISLVDRRRDGVLIIRTDGLGDALLFEPALQAISGAMPSRRIHLWAPQLACDLLAHCPSVHRLMVIPRGFKPGNLGYFVSFKWRATVGFALGRWVFDKVIYPVQSPEPLGNWLLASARTGERWVSVGDTINQFDWQRGRTHERATRILQRRPDVKHELLQNEHLARQCNAEDVPAKPTLYVPESTRAAARQQAQKWRAQSQKVGGREVVGVVPAASMTLNSYPDASWAEALGRLWQQRRAAPILLGGPDDADALHRFAGELSRQRVPWFMIDQSPGILEMAALVAEFDAVLSMDTGLAHLAIAQQVPTVVLVGGGNPGRFFPWPDAPHHVMLSVTMPCEQCDNRCMFREAACITLITPEQIVAAYARLKHRRVSLPLYPDQPQPMRAAG